MTQPSTVGEWPRSAKPALFEIIEFNQWSGLACRQRTDADERIAQRRGGGLEQPSVRPADHSLYRAESVRSGQPASLGRERATDQETPRPCRGRLRVS